VVAANILGRHEAHYEAVLRVTYTDPQAAAVGDGERAIRARGPLEVLRDTIQPFPGVSEIHAAALKTLDREVAGARDAIGTGSR
jgi:pyruvate/2-oxoglutarate dehydrogenase complex dihydrolipoamide dehydrogenase (E3) component